VGSEVLPQILVYSMCTTVDRSPLSTNGIGKGTVWRHWIWDTQFILNSVLEDSVGRVWPV